MSSDEWLAARDRVCALYGDEYTARYTSLYTTPWVRKHELNVQNLARLLAGLRSPSPRWLDLACGQGWHFARFAGRARMLGVDLSWPQLVRARTAVPSAAFARADISELSLHPGAVDLVTNFWAGYCYLASRERVLSLWRTVPQWIAPDGALYVEVLLGRDLATFNGSRFADQTGFMVRPRSDDHSEWQYDDVGGRHIMTSPPLQDFLEILSPAFRHLEAVHDGSFLVHLIATGRR